MDGTSPIKILLITPFVLFIALHIARLRKRARVPRSRIVFRCIWRPLDRIHRPLSLISLFKLTLEVLRWLIEQGNFRCT